MRLACCVAAIGSIPSPQAAAETTLVDVIPRTLQSEFAQNSEPSIAVNPLNPDQVMITAFGAGAAVNPVFFSKDGGKTWVLHQYLASSDTSLAWGTGGNVYLANLSTSGAMIAAWKATRPELRHRFAPLARSHYRPRGDGADQPWIEVATIDRADRIFVAFNDLSQPSQTASIRYSLDRGTTWRNTVIERGVPGDGYDGAAVRVASRGTRVYAVFERFNARDTNGDELGEVVIVRDDAGGAGGFKDLGAGGVGVTIAGNVTLPQGFLGQERLGSDLSIAIDPNDSNRLSVAFAAVSGGRPFVAVTLSTDGGVTWQQVFATTEGSALPAIAIASNGTIGLLYTNYDGSHLETRFTQSFDVFTSHSEETLSRFEDQSLVPVFDPFIGDYQDLVAVGNVFFGTFSASNETDAFPKRPVLLRDATRLGVTVPFSIDPYFFKTPAIEAP